MMSRQYTLQQQDAIFTDGGNILVSAAAGSGKTAVLVERIIKKITDRENPVDIDDFLIVTFTKAAAAEMKERIYKAVEKYCINEPENENYQRQLILCNKAKITTIDSFCYDIVKKYGYSAGVPYDFVIGDESKINLIKNNCLNNIIEEYYAERKDTDFLNLIKLFCDEKNDDKIFDVVLKIYDFVSKQPFSDKWLSDNLTLYKKACEFPFETKWFSENFLDFSVKLDFFIKKYNKMLYLIEEFEPLKGYEKKIKEDYLYIEKLKKAVDEKNYSEINSLFLNIPSGVIGRVKDFDGKEKSFCSETRSDFLSFLKESAVLFSVDDEKIIKSIKFHIPIIEKLTEIIKRLDKNIFENCVEEKTFSFNDIERIAVKILIKDYDFEKDSLEKTDIAEELSKEYKEILIDEFQDINLIQELVFRAVSKDDNNIYMVGDVKQSIYRFRQAMPEIFMSKKKLYNDVSEKKFPCLITLNKNFRSQKNILDFANFIFKQLFSEYTGELEYTFSEMLFQGKEDNEKGFINVSFIDSSSDYENEDIRNMTSVQREAIYISDQIQKMIKNKETIKENDVVRAVKYSDIAVLFRSKSGISDALIKEFKLRNIPYMSDEKEEYLTSYEVSSFISFLKVIDNPLDDIAVLSALRSPIFCFSFDELLEIRNKDRYEKFYFLIEKSENKKCKDFISKVKKYRELSHNVTVDILISKIINDFDVVSLYEAVKLNNNAYEKNGINENIQMLYNYAVSFENSGYKGLTAFIKYIDDIIKSKGDLAGGKKISQSQDAVNLISVHKSKGLEFPVCFLCGLSKSFNKTDFNNNLLLSYSLGMGFKFKDFENDYFFNNYIRKSIASKMIREFYSEELRILYVALTRPKNRLYMILSYKTNDNKDLYDIFSKKSFEIQNSDKLLSNSVLECNSFTDMLTMALLRHKDFKKFRETAKIDLLPVKQEGDIEFEIIKDEYFEDKNDDFKVNNQKVVNEIVFDEKLLSERISFKYQKKYLSNIPAKLSVSELKGRKYLKTYGDKEVEYYQNFRKPYFISENNINSIDRGIAFHKFMQYIDYSYVNSDNLVDFTNKLVNEGFLIENERQLLDIEKIKLYLNSSLFEKIKNSKKLIREYRFNMEIPIKYYDENIKDEENKILVQGVIDCIFQDEKGDYYVLDYKTDKADKEELLTRYKKQLELYEKAVNQIFKIEVKSKIIYGLYDNTEIYF